MKTVKKHKNSLYARLVSTAKDRMDTTHTEAASWVKDSTLDVPAYLQK